MDIDTWLSRPARYLPTFAFGGTESIRSAVRTLDRFELQLLEAVMVLPPGGGRAELDRLVDGRATHGQVDTGLDRLRELALIWEGEDDDQLLVAHGLSQVIPMPCGLAQGIARLLAEADIEDLQRIAFSAGVEITSTRSELVRLIASTFADPVAMAGLLEQLSPPARAVLTQLCVPGGLVSIRRRHESFDGYDGYDSDSSARSGPESPHEELIALGLLVPVDYSDAVVPREVAVAVRGGRVLLSLESAPPVLGEATPQARTDEEAAQAATTFVAALMTLLTGLVQTPLVRLQSGGVGVTELRRLAAALRFELPHVQILLGLLRDTAYLRFFPEKVTLSDAGRAFIDSDPADQWRELAEVWLRSDGSYLSTPALTSGSRRSGRRSARQLVALLRPGARLTAADLADRLSWHSPLAEPGQSRFTPASHRGKDLDEFLAEADFLGIASAGALSTHGQLLSTDPAAAADLLRPAMPPRVSDVVLQADLTATALGTPVASLARLLDGCADRESGGGGVVWRFRATSVRRHFDAGGGSEDLLTALASASRTPVPAMLRELVRDAAQKQGEVVVREALSVFLLRDRPTMARVLGDERLAALELSAVAPLVLAARVRPTAALDQLRKTGYAPVLVTGS